MFGSFIWFDPGYCILYYSVSIHNSNLQLLATEMYKGSRGLS